MSLLVQRLSTEQQLAWNVNLKPTKLYFIKNIALNFHCFESEEMG